jgi:hypothetical protein
MMQVYEVQLVAAHFQALSPALDPWRSCHLNSTAAFFTVCQIPQRRGIVTGSQAKTTSAQSLFGELSGLLTLGRIGPFLFPR